MATLVAMREGDGVVTANISIDGIVFWHFLYSADDAELARSGTTSEIHEFELGEPAKLNRDVNTWHIVLMNPTAAPVEFETSITWMQGGRVVAIWPAGGPHTGTLNSNDSVIFDDSAFLVVLPDDMPGGGQ